MLAASRLATASVGGQLSSYSDKKRSALQRRPRPRLRRCTRCRLPSLDREDLLHVGVVPGVVVVVGDRRRRVAEHQMDVLGHVGSPCSVNGKSALHVRGAQVFHIRFGDAFRARRSVAGRVRPVGRRRSVDDRRARNARLRGILVRRGARWERSVHSCRHVARSVFEHCPRGRRGRSAARRSCPG